MPTTGFSATSVLLTTPWQRKILGASLHGSSINTCRKSSNKRLHQNIAIRSAESLRENTCIGFIAGNLINLGDEDKAAYLCTS